MVSTFSVPSPNYRLSRSDWGAPPFLARSPAACRAFKCTTGPLSNQASPVGMRACMSSCSIQYA
eukprot:6737049-Prymnesium_polylepis.1